MQHPFFLGARGFKAIRGTSLQGGGAYLAPALRCLASVWREIPSSLAAMD
jgi:hypothetical protein